MKRPCVRIMRRGPMGVPFEGRRGARCACKRRIVADAPTWRWYHVRERGRGTWPWER
jgi:hypothetical protein